MGNKTYSIIFLLTIECPRHVQQRICKKFARNVHGMCEKARNVRKFAKYVQRMLKECARNVLEICKKYSWNVHESRILKEWASNVQEMCMI